MSGLLKLIYSVDQEWPPRRRQRLARDVKTALLCTRASLEQHGIEAATSVLLDHWEHITVAYPTDWVEVAREAGVL